MAELQGYRPTELVVEGMTKRQVGLALGNAWCVTLATRVVKEPW